MASILKKPLKLALIQLATGPDKAANLTRARSKVVEAAKAGASLIVLPECFNSPYGTQHFANYAETLEPSPPTAAQSPSFHALSAMAAETSTWIIGGSIPERAASVSASSSDATSSAPPSTTNQKNDAEPPKYHNTSLTFSPTGTLVATHRKVHLFDIDIPGKIRFRESEVLTAGNQLTIFDMPPWGRVAVAICYDIRFPELATIAARRGCFLLVYPGAFNTTTGPLHWSLQARARAVDNQTYVALCSPARDDAPDAYHAWGHSMVVDPNAEVLVEADESERIVYAECSGERIDEVRKGIPLYEQRRFDVYPDVSAVQVERK
ncbi:MAG: hypothetical protein M1825_000434 [Sarcosagium campestre]|nr:MAG: hypothetical protein M1825_000434 [Sarcosagium campestre]